VYFRPQMSGLKSICQEENVTFDKVEIFTSATQLQCVTHKWQNDVTSKPLIKCSLQQLNFLMKLDHLQLSECKHA